MICTELHTHIKKSLRHAHTHVCPHPHLQTEDQRSGLSGVCGTQEVLPGGAIKTTGEGFCSLSVPLVHLSDPHLLYENHFRDAACFTNQLLRLFPGSLFFGSATFKTNF